MYKSTVKSQFVNALFLATLLFIGIILKGEWMYKLVILGVALFILRDVYREWCLRYELTKTSLKVYMKTRLVKEIKYKDVKYITITRKNRKWVVLANDEQILFVIKPKIENYENMVTELLEKTKSNHKIEVHDLIKKFYKK